MMNQIVVIDVEDDDVEPVGPPSDSFVPTVEPMSITSDSLAKDKPSTNEPEAPGERERNLSKSSIVSGNSGNQSMTNNCMVIDDGGVAKSESLGVTVTSQQVSEAADEPSAVENVVKTKPDPPGRNVAMTMVNGLPKLNSDVKEVIDVDEYTSVHVDLRGPAMVEHGKRPLALAEVHSKTSKLPRMCSGTIEVNGLQYMCVDEECHTHHPKKQQVSVSRKGRGVLRSTTEVIYLSSDDESDDTKVKLDSNNFGSDALPAMPDEPGSIQENMPLSVHTTPEQTQEGTILKQVEGVSSPVDTTNNMHPNKENHVEQVHAPPLYVDQLVNGHDTKMPVPLQIYGHTQCEPQMDTCEVIDQIEQHNVPIKPEEINPVVPIQIQPISCKSMSETNPVVPIQMQPISCKSMSETIIQNPTPANMGGTMHYSKLAPGTLKLEPLAPGTLKLEPLAPGTLKLEPGSCLHNNENRSPLKRHNVYSELEVDLDAKVDQLRDATKLPRKIAERFYDILVKQPFVILEQMPPHLIHNKSSDEEEKSVSHVKACPWCRKQFVFEKSLVYHVNMYHKHAEMPHHCRDCGMGFLKQISLNAHVQHKHLTQPMEECPYCHKLYAKSFLWRHINRKHITTQTQCQICNAIFQTPSELPYHMKLFHSKPVTKQTFAVKRGFQGPRCVKCSSVLSRDGTCKMCAGSVVQTTGMTSESKMTSKTDNIYIECPKCCKAFVGMDNRDRHYRMQHDEKTMPFHCSQCGKGFLVEEVMHSHIRYLHDRVKTPNAKKLQEKFPYSSLDCQSLLRKLVQLQRDGKVFEMADKKNICPFCDGLFPCQRERDMHFREVHGEESMPYHCDICSRGYFQPTVLLKHYRLNHEDIFNKIVKELDDHDGNPSPPREPEIPNLIRSGYLSCPECGKMFSEMSKRDLHYRRMHNEVDMPYKCPKCSRGYLNDESLKKHKTSLCKFNQLAANMVTGSPPSTVIRQALSVTPPESMKSDSSNKERTSGAKPKYVHWKSRPEQEEYVDPESTAQPIIEKPSCSVCGKIFLTAHGRDWHVKDKHGCDTDQLSGVVT